MGKGDDGDQREEAVGDVLPRFRLSPEELVHLVQSTATFNFRLRHLALEEEYPITESSALIDSHVGQQTEIAKLHARLAAALGCFDHESLLTESRFFEGEGCVADGPAHPLEISSDGEFTIDVGDAFLLLLATANYGARCLLEEELGDERALELGRRRELNGRVHNILLVQSRLPCPRMPADELADFGLHHGYGCPVCTLEKRPVHV